MVKTYSLREHGSTFPLSAHFTLGEFACKGADEVLVSEELIFLLEEIRAWARLKIATDAVVVITSGYRTEEHNKSLPKAAKGSYHVKGMAADIKVRTGRTTVDEKRVYDALDGGFVSEWEGGLGLYLREGDRGWVHVDVRGKLARWTG